MSFRGVIAIDGPSGSGKSTVAKEIARRLGLRYLDTGAMYRAVTVGALSAGLSLRDQASVADFARRMELFVSTDTGEQVVVVNGRDLTHALRTTATSESVSDVATNLAVRAELVARQQAAIAGGGIVLEGRDTTSVVAPHADVRLMIVADPDARVARRTMQLHGVVDQDTISATTAQIKVRDARDSTVVDFQNAGTGVIEIDSTALTLEQTVDTALHYVYRTRAWQDGKLT